MNKQGGLLVSRRMRNQLSHRQNFPGKVWYVDSGHSKASDSTNNGRSENSPFATIDYAVGKCTASNGDVILVMPGHVETVATASALDFDVAGIKVIGLGWGDLRPKVQLSAAASTVEFNADDMWIEGIIFESTYTGGVVVGLDIKTGCDDLTIKDCVIRGTATTKELLKGVTIEATNNRITFDGCYFYEFTGGDATAAVTTEGAFTNLSFINCRFNGDWSTSVLDLDAAAVTAEGLYMEDVTIIQTDAATAGLSITLDNTTVAYLLRVNVFGGKDGVIPLAAADDGATKAIECYGTDAAGVHGLIWPTAAVNWT